MGDQVKQQNEAFEKDFNTLYAKSTWTKDDIAQMKDLKKLIYYNKVICAMDEGGEYPGSDYMPETAMSYRRGRNQYNGQFMSRDGGSYNGGGSVYGMSNNGGGYNNGGSGVYYPDNPMWNAQSWSNNTSGRRYYDSEKEKAIHKLHHMMENTDDPERKNALKIAINELEMK